VMAEVLRCTPAEVMLQFFIVNCPESIYIAPGEPLDQTGTIGHLYCSRFAVTRMGREKLSNRSSTGAVSRTI
jgi:hypothetical protein